MVYGCLVDVYPSGAWDVDAVGVFVGGKGVDRDASLGVFQDEVDKALCCGGFGFIGVGVDVVGDNGGGSSIAGEGECGGVVRVVVDAQPWFGFLFFIFWAQMGVDEGADKPA